MSSRFCRVPEWLVARMQRSSAPAQLRKCIGVDQLQHLHRLIVQERSVIDRFNPCDESNNDICSGYDIELINEQCNLSAYACCKHTIASHLCCWALNLLHLQRDSVVFADCREVSIHQNLHLL